MHAVKDRACTVNSIACIISTVICPAGGARRGHKPVPKGRNIQSLTAKGADEHF